MTRGTYTPWESSLPPPPVTSGMEFKFPVGQTRHGQTIELLAAKHTDGKVIYTLKKHAAGQRDDTVTIFNLEAETMDRIAQAVAVIKGLK